MTLFLLSLLALLLVLSGGGIVNTMLPPNNSKPSQPPATPNVNSTGVYNYASDGSLTGAPITNDQSTYPGASSSYPSAGVWNICTAVALAEGYNQGKGAAPYDLNNPGDLSPGDEARQQTCGGAQFHGGSNIILFCTAEAGFVALYTKFFDIVSGNSSIYPASLTWTQVAQKYAGAYVAWLSNVTTYLGVDPNSTPAQYVAGVDGAS